MHWKRYSTLPKNKKTNLALIINASLYLVNVLLLWSWGACQCALQSIFVVNVATLSQRCSLLVVHLPPYNILFFCLQSLLDEILGHCMCVVHFFKFVSIPYSTNFSYIPP